MSSQTPTHALWTKLSGVPGGRALFSLSVSLKAPYFRTVLPSIQEMEPGRCVVTSPKWWGVHNHIGTYHAIAACNLAEVAMGMVAEATVPTSHRWLPKKMQVDYVAKAETSMRAVAELESIPEFGDEGQEVDVPVNVHDKHGKVVVRAVITIWVTRKKR
ncbi:hotdog fold domain-containing protein [Saccharopolyspora sp. TS4A08]|uniref:Hotdog fold domain-containing protein n=1 Tax=Saccharopolyspora ipomoeae TaxID=3042027 RepID=A0ABT6PGZ4_9PSEU|nr:hotdog fold domain-containing protein [Saccharopolyspora sp. TS4A08]MDI2027135.1 hotdog fold domain-containing protein [Saccharopolyspora sp. TS4A08]